MKDDLHYSKTAIGREVIRLTGTERAGHCFYSDFIDTGFGPGLFDLHIVVEDRCGYDEKPLEEGRILFGDPSVFSQSTYVPGVPSNRIGAYADTSTGKFRIGFMLTAPAMRCSVVLRWWAESVQREPDNNSLDETKENDSLDFYISKMPRDLCTGESFQLAVACPSEYQGYLRFDADEGTITEDGLYTAPSEQGIYQITARVEGTDLVSSVFVMVR